MLGLRFSVRQVLRRERLRGLDAFEQTVAAMSTGPVAIETAAANDQHYELPAQFFGLALGPRRKYSGCFWPEGVETLADAEETMLALTCARAGIVDGMERMLATVPEQVETSCETTHNKALACPSANR